MLYDVCHRCWHFVKSDICDDIDWQSDACDSLKSDICDETDWYNGVFDVQVFSESGDALLNDGIFWSLMFVALGGLNLITNIIQVMLPLPDSHLTGQCSHSLTLAFGPLKGGWEFLMSLPDVSGLPLWSHFSISPLLFFCLVLLLFLSYYFLLLAHSPVCPDITVMVGWALKITYPTLLTSFSLNLYFPKGRLFCLALYLSG